MPTRRDPILVDEFPREWDAKKAQRVLEGAIRRLTDEGQDEEQLRPRDVPAAPEDPLVWVL